MGSLEYNQARTDFLDIIRAATANYRRKTCNRLAHLQVKDRRWWSITRELLHGQVKLSSIPALRTSDGEWVTDSMRKANLFSEIWQRKFKLPPKHPDAFFFFQPQEQVPEASVLYLRSRVCEKIFKRLNLQSATGPDELSNRIFTLRRTLYYNAFHSNRATHDS